MSIMEKLLRFIRGNGDVHISMKEANAGLQPYPPRNLKNPAAENCACLTWHVSMCRYFEGTSA